MVPQSLKYVLASALVGGALVMTTPVALATTTFDGTWVIEVPSADLVSGTSYSVCPALQFPIQVEDGRVSGYLTQVPAAADGITVESGTGPVSAPVTGAVAPNGEVNARWENYRAYGTLAGNTGQVTIKGECGPRTAQAVRITR